MILTSKFSDHADAGKQQQRESGWLGNGVSRGNRSVLVRAFRERSDQIRRVEPLIVIPVTAGPTGARNGRVFVLARRKHDDRTTHELPRRERSRDRERELKFSR
jgi:hypothetical protein